MKIPVFVSCPTSLNKEQGKARKLILEQLEYLFLEPRALGRTDYPTDFPLKEVLVLAKHCSGGVILGFEQFTTDTGTSKRGTKEEQNVAETTIFPSPWNQLEAGMLFSLGKPLIVFKENKLVGGVFDPGAMDVFIHKMPMGEPTAHDKDVLKQVFLKWQGKVHDNYYAF